MKKLIFLLLIFTFFSGFGQVHYGIKAGLNQLYPYSRTNYNNIKILNSGINMFHHFGVFINIGLSNKYRLQSEIIYSDRGRLRNDYSPKNMLHFKYICIPVLMSYHPNSTIFFEGGAEFGYLISFFANDKINEKHNIYNKTDFSILTGVELETLKFLSFGLRFSYGLNSIFKNVLFEENGEKIIRNDIKINFAILRFYIGIRFG